MLVALYENQFVDMIGDVTKEQWNHKMKTGLLLCPVCKNKVIPKCGTKKIWHFAHQSYDQCSGNHEAETNYHLLGKKGLYLWLKKNGELPILECYLSEIAQRPDLYLPQKNYALEFQCATITEELLKSRAEGYRSLNMKSEWLFGMKRIKKKQDYLYTIQPTDLAAVQKDKAGKLYLNYYCPLQQQFLLLRNVLPLSQRKVSATPYTFSEKGISDIEWLSKSFPEKCQSHQQVLWNNQKTTWRMTAYKNGSPSIMYVKKVLYFNHKSLTLFSSIAGMPTLNYFAFETSPFIWQTYLLFFIEHLPTTTFTLRQILNEFERMIVKRIFQVRDFPYLEVDFCDAIKGYLTYLESEKFVECVHSDIYKKIALIPYPKTMDQALQQDKIFSKKALNINLV